MSTRHSPLYFSLIIPALCALGCAHSPSAGQLKDYAALAEKTAVVKASSVVETRYRSAKQQAEASQRIVLAKCTGSEVKLGLDGNIYTFFNFQTEDTLKGRIGSTFALRFLGGALNGVEISLPIDTGFQSGQSYLLFLGHDNAEGFPVLSPQHIYSVLTNPGDGKRIVVPAPAGMEIYRAGSDKIASFSDRFAMYDDFRYSVGRIVKNTK
jgi:hypothetical protein